jgi:hypothetical protein
MKKTVPLFLLIAALLSLFTSCHKCHDKEYSPLHFSQEDLKINPYSGNETLVFTDVYGDSVVLPGQGRSGDKELNYSNDPDGDDLLLYRCYGNYYYADVNYCQFATQGNNAYFEVNLYFTNEFRQSALEKLIRLNLDTHDPNANSGFMILAFDGDSIFNSRVYPNDSVLGYEDTMHLGNYLYHKVYKLGKPENYLYYSVLEGLVGFRTVGDTLFCLSRKIK